ncbi:hypothetical protein CH300_04805 [Rhodococcus sp. 15-1154-1]|nr:hypothetical protein CH300_04805 [Rhodococcus sp. 15-1154-1]
MQMRKQGSGAIVNCSSLGGLVGGDGRATYHATKHGVIGATKSVALQYGKHGVRVNAVCPGTIGTPMVERMIVGGELDPDAAAAGVPLGRLGGAGGDCCGGVVAVQRRRELRHGRCTARRCGI